MTDMTRTLAAVTRSNAVIILKAVRGKSKSEREIMYAQFRLGPWSFPIVAMLQTAKAMQ